MSMMLYLVNSQTIEAVWGEDRPGSPILFAGHYDTVNCSAVEDAKPGAADVFDGTLISEQTQREGRMDWVCWI